MLDRLLALVIKELQALFAEPQSRRLLIVPVIVQVLVFPWAATLEVKNSSLAVFNADAGPASIELTQRLARAGAFTRLMVVHGDAALRRAIDSQQAFVAVRIPEDFSRTLARGGNASLQAIVDARRSNSAQVAFGYVQSIVQDYAREVRPQAGDAMPVVSTIDVRHQYNPNLENQWFIVPSLVGIITTLGCLIVTALSIAREREQGTFDQLLVSPLRPGMILIGKAIPALLVALMQATIVLAAAVALYHVPVRGSLALLYSALVCYGAALLGIGLLISSVCSTQQQAFLAVFSTMLPAILLSGFLGPIENMPSVLQTLSIADPVRHMLFIAKSVLVKGAGVSIVGGAMLTLLAIGAVTASAAYAMFRRRTA